MKYEDCKPTIFYKKEGKRYVPVAEYNREFSDSFVKGSHLVVCRPGSISRRYDVDPDFAAMMAAGLVAEDAISKKIVEATDLRLSSEARKKPLTPGQRKAWDNLIKEFGEEANQLEWPSAREAAQEAVKVMQEEAVKLLKNPAVKKAYEHFILVSKLTKEENDVGN